MRDAAGHTSRQCRGPSTLAPARWHCLGSRSPPPPAARPLRHPAPHAGDIAAAIVPPHRVGAPLHIPASRHRVDTLGPCGGQREVGGPLPCHTPNDDQPVGLEPGEISANLLLLLARQALEEFLSASGEEPLAPPRFAIEPAEDPHVEHCESSCRHARHSSSCPRPRCGAAPLLSP